MIKIFLDSSDLNAIREYKDKVQGFTTNPTLMRKAGVVDYEKFCKEVLAEVRDKPVSFEVFADDFDQMERQARLISGWGENVYVKVPITNTKGEYSVGLIKKLSDLKLNITAVTELDQVENLKPVINSKSIISIFAGRIADTGREPGEYVSKSKSLIGGLAQILWASPREVLNIYQAEEAGADIITCTSELIAKYEKFKGMDLKELSLETVKMFYNDGKEAGYKL
ncbi:MAG: transaldolase family protein [Patescibacteria group bacterium]